MNRLYETIANLCDAKGIKPGRMCSELGISRGNLSDLKMGRIEKLSTESLSKISTYFGVTVDYLLGNEQEKQSPTQLTDDDIKFALFDGDREITDEMFEEVKAFAKFVKQREQKKKDGKSL